MDLQTAKSELPTDLLPQPYELHGLRPGSIIKIQLLDGSRLWVQVVSRRRPNRTYVGEVLDSRVVHVRRGSMVVFEAGHVFEIA